VPDLSASAGFTCLYRASLPVLDSRLRGNDSGILRQWPLAAGM